MKKIITITLCMCSLFSFAYATDVKIRDIARFDGVRDNVLTGYGIVVGLSGSGDSSRSNVTYQSLKNTLVNFDLIVSEDDISSRNVAAVIITASLPPFAQEGDKLDIQVSSIGDARSLMGGTLISTPLEAANGEVYALAQGALSVGGYQFEKFDNVVQKNHPTVGQIPQGATVEKSINNTFVKEDGSVHLILNSPDFSTVTSVVERLNTIHADLNITPIHASRIKISPLKGNQEISGLFNKLSSIENTYVATTMNAKVVINERTGTIVSGANIKISNVIVSHGSLKLTINTEYNVSQPEGLFLKNSPNIETVVVPNSELSVNENDTAVYLNREGTDIGQVVDSLLKLNLSTRDVISILQALKKAGAMNAEIVIQ